MILGCSHFVFAFHEIEEELDQGTRLLNPTLAVAQEVSRHIQDPKPKSHTPKHSIYASGDLDPIRAFLKKNPPSSPVEVLHTSDIAT